MCVVCVYEVRDGVGVLGETHTGSIPSRKLMKEIRLVGNPTITLIFILEIERSPYWEWWGWVICNAKTGWWRRKAQLSCSGALLPSSFGRITDLCFETERKGSNEVRGRDFTSEWTSFRLQHIQIELLSLMRTALFFSSTWPSLL